MQRDRDQGDGDGDGDEGDGRDGKQKKNDILAFFVPSIVLSQRAPFSRAFPFVSVRSRI